MHLLIGMLLCTGMYRVLLMASPATRKAGEACKERLSGTLTWMPGQCAAG